MLKSPLPFFGGGSFQAKPVRYVVPAQPCHGLKSLFPNARVVKSQIERQKPIVSLENRRQQNLGATDSPLIAWFDVLLQEMAKTQGSAYVDRQEALQAYREFLATGLCSKDDESCFLAANALRIQEVGRIASDDFNRMLTFRYGPFLDKKEQEKLREKLFLALGVPQEISQDMARSMKDGNGKAYKAVLDYEKWVWTYAKQSTIDQPWTSSAYYAVSLYTSSRSVGSARWLDGLIKPFYPSLSSDLWTSYVRSNIRKGMMGYNTTLKPFELPAEIKSFYERFHPNKNAAAKEVRAVLQNWTLNNKDKVKNHLFDRYDPEVGAWEKRLQDFLQSVPSYAGDLYLPPLRGDRAFANQLMLNVSEITQRSQKSFRLSELLPGLQPNRLMVGDLDSLIAAEGTGFTAWDENKALLDDGRIKSLANMVPEAACRKPGASKDTVTIDPQGIFPFQCSQPSQKFFGVMVRIKSPDIKVTYPLDQGPSFLPQIKYIKIKTTQKSMGSVVLPQEAFTGFVLDGPGDLYQIEKIEKINPNVTPMLKTDPDYHRAYEFSFDIMITVTKVAGEGKTSAL